MDPAQREQGRGLQGWVRDAHPREEGPRDTQPWGATAAPPFPAAGALGTGGAEQLYFILKTLSTNKWVRQRPVEIHSARRDGGTRRKTGKRSENVVLLPLSGVLCKEEAPNYPCTESSRRVQQIESPS